MSARIPSFNSSQPVIAAPVNQTPYAGGRIGKQTDTLLPLNQDRLTKINPDELQARNTALSLRHTLLVTLPKLKAALNFTLQNPAVIASVPSSGITKDDLAHLTCVAQAIQENRFEQSVQYLINPDLPPKNKAVLAEDYSNKALEALSIGLRSYEAINSGLTGEDGNELADWTEKTPEFLKTKLFHQSLLEDNKVQVLQASQIYCKLREHRMKNA